MTLTLDTNVLVRLAVEDDPAQALSAKAIFAGPEPVVVTSQTLCEFVWVLSSSYKLPRGDIAGAIRTLMRASGVVLDRAHVETGLSMLERGGDFADGVILSEGLKLGGDRFVSFDRKAVHLATEAGFKAELLR